MTQRKYLFRTQGGKCHYCGIQMSLNPSGRYFATEDHLMPKSVGGSNMFNNLVGACFTCNNMRGTIPYQHFKLFIQLHGNKQPISKVLKTITRKQFEKYPEMYEAVRSIHHRKPLPFPIDLGAVPSMTLSSSVSMSVMISAPEPEFRRRYLQMTRRNIESIIIGIGYKKAPRILKGRTQ